MKTATVDAALAAAQAGRRLAPQQALALAHCHDLARLSAIAQEICLAGHARRVSFSKKVFIPLTHLCRDVCHYCTFARPPRQGEAAYLTPDAVLAIANAGRAAGCKEALFTLGDKPELRYSAARRALDALAAASTLDYLEASAELVLRETGLLPHLNPGLMDEAWLRRLRRVSVSQGIMLETASARLSAPGGPHYGSPDKDPAARLGMLEAAGRARVPFTTGILIGIGETRSERIEALLAIRDVHERHGHIQEIIIQNFRAKPGTRMAQAAEPALEEQVWTVAVARLLFGSRMNIQAPPNLRPDGLAQLLAAGINDWGGVSPVTPDHVNPEAPWPHLEALSEATERAGRTLVERLAVYPAFLTGEAMPAPTAAAAADASRAGAAAGRTPAPARQGELWRLRLARSGAADTDTAPPRWRGLCARERLGAGWARAVAGPAAGPAAGRATARQRRSCAILARAAAGEALTEAQIVRLFAARGRDFAALVAAADRLRQQAVGNTVTYVVNRNINYTNICTYGCKFCAFSKGRHNLGHRDKPYDLDAAEIAQANQRGLAAGSHRGVSAGRHPARLHRRYLPWHRCRREIRGAADARACLLTARDLARRGDAFSAAGGLPVAAEGSGLGEPAWHGGGNPRR